MEEDFRTERQLYLMRRISLNLTEQLELNLKDGNISGIQVIFWSIFCGIIRRERT